VIAPPHPQYAGTPDNKVVYTVARSFHDLGVPTLRFNFRGVGKSAGSFAEGIGETDDALAAVAFASGRWPGAAVWLGGFSFGGAVAVRTAARLQPARLVTVAPAIRRVSLGDAPLPECPWLIVQGDADDLVDHRDVLDWASHMARPPQIALLQGVGHFFHGKLNELRDAVVAFGRGAS
jgi:alpha/beta superfamily hydrolase